MKTNTELHSGGAISSSAVVRPTIWQELKLNLWWRGPIHKAIVWYLRRAGGAFHTYPYGPSGRYVVLMNENQYHHYEKNRRHWPNDALCESAGRKKTHESKGDVAAPSDSQQQMAMPPSVGNAHNNTKDK